MSKRNSTLTQERLKELLHYEPETGVFTRKVSLSRRTKVGQIAGDRQRARRGQKWRVRFCVDGKRYFSHQIAWLYFHGVWPVGDIDHIDGNSMNNSIRNLRDVWHRINCENRTAPQTNNRSGFLGVFWEKRFHVWIAKVTVKRKSIHIGSFATKEEAHAAYLKAKRELHLGCTI